MANALQFFARVNNRPENCKKKLRIFGLRRLPFCPLARSCCQKACDLKASADVLLGKTAQFELFSRMPASFRQHQPSRIACVVHASRVLFAASRRNKLFKNGKTRDVFHIEKVRERETRSPACGTHALPFRQKIDNARLRDAVSAGIELQATR